MRTEAFGKWVMIAVFRSSTQLEPWVSSSKFRVKNDLHLKTKKARLNTHVYVCVFRTELLFDSTYVGSIMSMETNIITTITQPNAENPSVKGLWQLGFRHKYKTIFWVKRHFVNAGTCSVNFTLHFQTPEF